jgi:hypothetical protein
MDHADEGAGEFVVADCNAGQTRDAGSYIG